MPPGVCPAALCVLDKKTDVFLLRADFLPKKQEKEVISIRISTDLLATVDQKSASFDISRNEFINQCILFALAHMENEA